MTAIRSVSEWKRERERERDRKKSERYRRGREQENSDMQLELLPSIPQIGYDISVASLMLA